MTSTNILFIIFVIVLILVGPLLLIWSINTLFPVLAIPYNIWTWLAAGIISLTFGSKSK